MRYLFLVAGVCLIQSIVFGRMDSDKIYYAKANASTQAQRNLIVNAGISLEGGVFSDSVGFIGTQKDINLVKMLGFEVEVYRLPKNRDFPLNDAAYHNYEEMIAAIQKIGTDYPDIATVHLMGKSLEGRDLLGLRLSSVPEADILPTAVFLGCHHAREHLSVEVPLKMAQYLTSQYARDVKIQNLLKNREIWIFPMINPDGAEYDIAQGSYRFWRKNRRSNGDGTYGVDLNRNYGKNWGGNGSSGETSSDIYRGPSAFSEPETQAVRDFLRERKKTTVLITFHTFSELILWPWGYTNDVISNTADREVFEAMGKKMATWNRYRPQKSSQLYITSGDTTDWAYDELGIFAFTFELSPSSIFGGGFYPGAKAIEPTFKENIEPMLYLAEMAEDPYESVAKSIDPLGVIQ